MNEPLAPDALQLAFHEVECLTYDERFALSYDAYTAREAAREARRLLGSAHLGRVLDVGCGTGYLGLGLAHAGQISQLHLTDLSPGMLGRAARNAQALGVAATLTQATATALPYADQTFDAVVTRGVLHHLIDPVAALTEWRRVVRPGGPVLALSEPTPAADAYGGLAARAALRTLAAARPLAARLGHPLSAHGQEEGQLQRYWDLVAMAANLHTFTPRDLAALGTAAGFASSRTSGSGLTSISWAAAYYCLAGELPDLAASERAKRRSGRTYAALRRLDATVVERLVPDRFLMTVQAVFRD